MPPSENKRIALKGAGAAGRPNIASDPAAASTDASLT
jgi:hypothetical protein